MEHKGSNVLVGAVVLALFVALFGFVLWLSRVDTREEKRYDIFFKEVSGLAVGSQVQFSGVPVGAVDEIRLMPENPEFVRVRIQVGEEVPILQGTTATLSSVGFTGVSLIQLDGAIRGAPPIEDEGPFGEPVIPTKPGALGELLSSAPELLERVSALTERLTRLFDNRNQESIAGILNNSERISRAFADRSDEIAATAAEARFAVRELGLAANSLAKAADASTKLVNEDGKPLIADMRRTVQRADATLAAVESTAKAAKPGIETFSTQTVPELGQLVRDMRDITNSLGAVAAKLDEDPAGALVGGRTLPDYEPEKSQ
ncbi:MlaD family protein [Sphingoaurantiacus capsulatus]|uniref:MlaD family protein n=1 Tax=Sphingoaurantiacus capsulatus TaxID=1771310 RepID=A0ABV7X8K2_9SPHN